MPKIIAIIFCVLVLVTVIELIREERLTFKYAFGWMGGAVLGLLFSFFDGLLFKLANIFGFELPSNFVFFAILCVLVLISLVMTIFLCQQNNRNDTMAQRLSMLEFELDQLKESKSQKEQGHE